MADEPKEISQLAEGCRWLTRIRDGLRLAHKIILAVGVPAVLICLMFLVSVPSLENTYWRGRVTGQRWTLEIASGIPVYWLGLTLSVAGFQWFLWGSAKNSASGDDN